MALHVMQCTKLLLVISFGRTGHFPDANMVLWSFLGSLSCCTPINTCWFSVIRAVARSSNNSGGGKGKDDGWGALFLLRLRMLVLLLGDVQVAP
eukprot:1152701-Pelagomonas_calceolata.AAC.1